MLTGVYKWESKRRRGHRFELAGVSRAGELYQDRYWQEPIFAAEEKYREDWCVERGFDMTTTAVAWVTNSRDYRRYYRRQPPEQLDASLAAADSAGSCEEDLQWLNQLGSHCRAGGKKR
jgi:hypothetical protein